MQIRFTNIMIGLSSYKIIMLMNPSGEDKNVLFYLKARLEQKSTVVIHMEFVFPVCPPPTHHIL